MQNLVLLQAVSSASSYILLFFILYLWYEDRRLDILKIIPILSQTLPRTLAAREDVSINLKLTALCLPTPMTISNRLKHAQGFTWPLILCCTISFLYDNCSECFLSRMSFAPYSQTLVHLFLCFSLTIYFVIYWLRHRDEPRSMHSYFSVSFSFLSSKISHFVCIFIMYRPTAMNVMTMGENLYGPLSTIEWIKSFFDLNQLSDK
jgi:hypothetical protein